LCLCVLSLTVVLSAPLWGLAGHQITALIAQRMLTSAATNQIDTLLPQQNGELYVVADWADQVRSQPAFKWSAPLHYADTPDWACYYTSSDCDHDMCVVSAISNYTTRQSDRKLALIQRVEALKFFVHFVGDVHQPLHVGFIGNLGGNKLSGTFMGKTTNLHSLWDTAIITKVMNDDFGGDRDAFVEYLWTRINGDWKKQADQWKLCTGNEETNGTVFAAPFGACPEVWADESAKLACDYCYVQADGKTPITNNFNLGQSYYDRNVEIVMIQLAKAGVRMGNILNNLYAALDIAMK